VNRIQDDDGGTGQIGIRQACAADCAGLGDFLAALSPQTRYLRFFTGAPRATASMLRLLAGGGDNIDAVVATEAGSIIGHAMAVDCMSCPGPRVAEVGVMVADAWQRQGIGSALTRELAERALARGVSTFAMDVLAENAQVLAMIASHWPGARYGRSGADVTIEAQLRVDAAERPWRADRLLAGAVTV
jgi:GNAT superfamily N-acetyltransferase